MRTEFEHEYTIGESVYHITPESPVGVVTNIRYSVLFGVDYLVVFSHNDESWCYEHELSAERRIV